MTFDFLNNVLLLDFSLEAAQGVLQRLALLNPYFGQRANTPKLVPNGPLCYPNVLPGSQVKSPTFMRRFATCGVVASAQLAELSSLETGPYRELDLSRGVRVGGHQELRILDEFTCVVRCLDLGGIRHELSR